jgi:hypothetical protein
MRFDRQDIFWPQWQLAHRRFGAQLLISGMIVSHWFSNASAPPRQTPVMTSLTRNDAR